MRTRVLMADDEVDVLNSLGQLLEAAGFSVVGKAQGGGEACRLAEELQPDVILLDIKMPDMDGLAATEEIMSHNPAPVVLCTAYCDEDLVLRAARAGVYSYLIKPFRLEHMVSAITLARARYADGVKLKEEVEQLGEALEDRKWIEKAKGIIMRAQKLAEPQAHRYLQLESQRRGQPVAELARAVVTADKLLHSHDLDEETVKHLTDSEGN